MFKVSAVSALLLAIVGCSSTPASQVPTHRWASTEAADKIQYRNDHVRCQAEARIDSTIEELDADGPGFAAYKACMNDSGYVLTAYNH